MHNKPWFNGPFNIKYEPCPLLYQELKTKNNQEIILEESKSKNNQEIILQESKSKNNQEIIKKPIPWREACVKSHKLFIWETKKLTII
jgi:hypothetical protein